MTYLRDLIWKEEADIRRMEADGSCVFFMVQNKKSVKRMHKVKYLTDGSVMIREADKFFSTDA